MEGPWYYVILILIAALAGFTQRVSGFGLGIVVVTFLPHFSPSHTAAVTIASLFSCFTTTYNTVSCWKKISFKTALPMACAALITVPIAVRFSAVVPGNLFRMLLGGVLILLSAYFLFFNKKIKMKPALWKGALAGTLGGVLGGLFSTGGPPAVFYLSNVAPDNATYFATIQFYFCITGWYSAGVRALNGMITGEILLCAAIGIIGCWIGNFIGGKVFSRLNAQKLKYVIYTGMIVSGILMFF